MKFESYHFVLKYKHHRIHDDTTLREQSKKRLTNIASISIFLSKMEQFLINQICDQIYQNVSTEDKEFFAALKS